MNVNFAIDIHTLQMAKDNSGAVQPTPESSLKWILVWRNVCRSDCCVLTALLLWLRVSGWLEHGIGPIFGHIDPRTAKLFKAHHEVLRRERTRTVKTWVTEDGKPVSFTSEGVAKQSRAIYSACGLHKCTVHSDRVLYASWGGRMERPLEEVIEGGNWSCFQSMEWFKYFKGGQSKHRNLLKDQGQDPLYNIFPWPERGMNPTPLGINVVTDWVRAVPDTARSGGGGSSGASSSGSGGSTRTTGKRKQAAK